jgi:hypothetical protein
MALFSLALLAVACSKKQGDEELIRQVIAEAAASAGEKDVSGVIKQLSKDYHDDRGLDYRAVKGVILGELIKPGGVKVFVTAVSVELKPPRAIAVAKAVLVRGKDVKSVKDIIPDDADAYKFTLLLKKEDNGWKVFNSSWESVSVAGLL